MPHETRSLREIRLANVAFVRTQAGVAQYVGAKGRLRKRPAAYRALAHTVLMHSPVARHLVGSSALFTALLALVHLLVQQQVIVQLGLTRKLPRAQVAVKLEPPVTLVQMLSHVAHEVLDLPAANVADVPAGRVRHEDVRGDVGLELEHLAAVIADVFPAGRAVRADLMMFQALAPLKLSPASGTLVDLGVRSLVKLQLVLRLVRLLTEVAPVGSPVSLRHVHLQQYIA